MSRLSGALGVTIKQLRITAPLSLLPALALLLFIPLTASLQNLREADAAMILDRLFPFTGLLLFTPLAGPEQDKAIREVVTCKRTSYLSTLLLRTGLALLLLPLPAFGLCGAMLALGSSFPFLTFALAATATALFLGALGFAAALVSDNIITGYLVPVCWYFVNYGLGARLRVFNMFSLAAGQLANKAVLAITALLLLTGAFLFLLAKNKKQGIL